MAQVDITPKVLTLEGASEMNALHYAADEGSAEAIAEFLKLGKLLNKRREETTQTCWIFMTVSGMFGEENWKQ